MRIPRSYHYFKAWWIIKRRSWLNGLLSKKHDQYTKFIILSAGRCGSTLLHTYLNSHPSILSKGEILRELYDDPGPNAPKDLSHIFSPMGSHIKAVGLKLFYDYKQMDRFKMAYKALAEDSTIKIIHLAREDTLAQFVSYKKAWRDLTWSKEKINGKQNEKIHIDLNEYQQFIKENERQKSESLRDFSSHEMIDITYEELSNGSQQIHKDILYFLKVENHRLFTALRRQNNKPLKEVIENWTEIERSLQSQ